MQIQRRKSTKNPSTMPPDPKVEREEKGRNAHTVIKDSIQNLDIMTQILQQNNLGDLIPEGAKKKKPHDQNPKKGNSSHASISINSSLDVWIVDSGASHHMDSTKVVYSSLDACKGPPILMGYNSLVEVTDKGRIELTNESFENVLHVPKLSVNIFSCNRLKTSTLERDSYSHLMQWISMTCKPISGLLLVR
jgi:hypothetical protein